MLVDNVLFIQEYHEKLEDYLKGRNWESGTCSSCGKEFYSKKELDTCGSRDCEGGYAFLSLPSRKKYVFLDDLTRMTNDFFGKRGYLPVGGQPVINTYVARNQSSGDSIGKLENTLFIVAGVQLMNDIIIREDEIPEESFFISQPSIRFPAIEKVGKIEGYSTSLVNICTEKINTTVTEHIGNMDNWLDYLSKVGLFVNDMTLTRGSGTENWGGGEFDTDFIDLNYRGLHLGDLGLYSNIPQKSRPPMTMSDIGFGLERICWALNKSKSYFDSVGPFVYSFREEHKLMDSIRTMVLMAGSGVKPSRTGCGYRLRKLSKNIVDINQRPPIEDLVPFYYDFWSNYLEFDKTLDETSDVILKEFVRNFNLELSDNLKTKIKTNQSEEDLIRSLINSNRGIKLSEIRELFKT